MNGSRGSAQFCVQDTEEMCVDCTSVTDVFLFVFTLSPWSELLMTGCSVIEKKNVNPQCGQMVLPQSIFNS